MHATEKSDEGNLPTLPEEVWTYWAYIFHICAATSIQATFRGFKTRHGPIRYLANVCDESLAATSSRRVLDMEFQTPGAVR